MRMKNSKLFKNILGLFLIFLLSFTVNNWGMIPAADAKTSESNPAENIFFYVTNQEGQDILLDVMSISELESISHGQLSGVASGENTGKNYYFSCTDNLPTTSYAEAQGFTLPELINYVKDNSPVAGAKSIAYADSDRLYFMASDSNAAYNRNYAYDQLYGLPQYYFPDLFTSWSSDWEISDSSYGPTDANPIPLEIYNSNYKNGDSYADDKDAVFAKGQRTVPILATQLEMDRVTNLSAEIAANDGQVTGCLKNALTADRALQLCIPQSEAVLMSGNRSAYHYFAWVYNMKLVMAEAPEIISLGTVGAPTANVTLNGDSLSITMDCATADAQIYYSLMDGAPQTLYSGEAVTWDIGSRDLAVSPVTFTMTAVKPGYDDAGIVSATYPQRAPAFTDIYNATVGNDVTFAAVASVSSDFWNDWTKSISSIGIRYPKAADYTILEENQYALNDSAKSISFPRSLFSAYGAHSFQIIADAYANKNFSLTMKKAAPDVVTKDYYLGSDIVLSFADSEYQSGSTLSVKKEGASSPFFISSSYLTQTVAGKLSIDKSCFNAANCAINAPGNYILTVTNSNYDPADQTVSIIVKAASEKPLEDSFAYTLTPSVSEGKVGESLTISVALLSDGDSYDFYAGEYRIVWDETALTLGEVAAEGKWKSGTRTMDGQTILTFAALDETGEGVAAESITEIGSFTVIPLQAGIASISCTGALLTDVDARALSKVEGNGLQINIKDLAYTPKTSSGGGGGGSSAAPTAGSTVSSSGATVSGSGASVVIPAGAVSSDIKVNIQKLDSAAVPSVASEYKLLGDVYEISQDKTGNFAKAVTITLPFDPSKMDKDKEEAAIYCWNNSQWAVLSHVKVDMAAGKVSGEVEHFSKFAVLARAKALPITAPTPAAGTLSLSDIAGHWAEAQIGQLVNAGAISGYPDGSFKPDNNITRAEFAAVLVKALKLEGQSGQVFNDTLGHWAKASINSAAAHGIVSGYDAASFGPDRLISREQMAVMLVKAAQLGAGEGKSFSDGEQIADWAKAAVASASDKNIISGYPDGSFKPQANATRAEAAAVIVRIMN